MLLECDPRFESQVKSLRIQCKNWCVPLALRTSCSCFVPGSCSCAGNREVSSTPCSGGDAGAAALGSCEFALPSAAFLLVPWGASCPLVGNCSRCCASRSSSLPVKGSRQPKRGFFPRWAGPRRFICIMYARGRGRAASPRWCRCGGHPRGAAPRDSAVRPCRLCATSRNHLGGGRAASSTRPNREAAGAAAPYKCAAEGNAQDALKTCSLGHARRTQFLRGRGPA